MTKRRKTPDWRALCVQLANELEHHAKRTRPPACLERIQRIIARETLLEAVGMKQELCNPLFGSGYRTVEHILETDPSVLMLVKGLGPVRVERIFAAIERWQRQQAAQSEPESVGPTDEELREIWETGHLPSAEDLANDDGEQDLQYLFTSDYYRWIEDNPQAKAAHQAKCLRAVFNAGRDWSRPAPAPAEGEVAELVAALRKAVDGAMAMGWEDAGFAIQRAAELLEQRHPAPVPVTERLPGPEDCDAEGRYWGLINGCEAWVLGKGSPGTLNITHWLPANTLPLPQGEVQP